MLETRNEVLRGTFWCYLLTISPIKLPRENEYIEIACRASPMIILKRNLCSLSIAMLSINRCWDKEGIMVLLCCEAKAISYLDIAAMRQEKYRHNAGSISSMSPWNNIIRSMAHAYIMAFQTLAYYAVTPIYCYATISRIETLWRFMIYQAINNTLRYTYIATRS